MLKIAPQSKVIWDEGTSGKGWRAQGGQAGSGRARRFTKGCGGQVESAEGSRGRWSPWGGSGGVCRRDQGTGEETLSTGVLVESGKIWQD